MLLQLNSWNEILKASVIEMRLLSAFWELQLFSAMDGWFATRMVPPFSVPPLTIQVANRVIQLDVSIFYKDILCFCVDGRIVRNNILIK